MNNIINKDVANAASMNAGNLGSERQKIGRLLGQGVTPSLLFLFLRRKFTDKHSIDEI
jgi:hypothetical protein